MLMRTCGFLLLMIAFLSGCTHYEPLSLHGAAAMRVEVDVYKGPATLSTGAQIGQTAALLSDYVRAMDAWWDEANQESGQASSQALQNAMNSARRGIGNACFIINTPAFKDLGHSIYVPIKTCEKWYDVWKEISINSNEYEQRTKFWENCRNYAEERYRKSAGLDQNVRATGSSADHNVIANAFKCYQGPILIAMESFSAMLRATAIRAGDANIRHVPGDPHVRGLLAAYAYTASTYGNQLSAMVQVLRKELNDTDPELLPTSDFLRGASNSDFVHLFEWLRATDRPQTKTLDVRGRVRMAERLSDSFNWEKVSEVYASGQGDVGMAFVKDAIGNWGLKSFSNDPTKLLAAYRKVTDAVLLSAAKLAGKAATGGAGDALQSLTAAQRATALANQLGGGETEATTPLDVAAMHDRVIARVRARQAVLEKQAVALATQRSSLAETQAALQGRIDSGEAAPEDQPSLAAQRDGVRAQIAQIDQRIALIPGQAMEAYRDIFEDHSLVLGEMEQAIAAPPPPPTTTTTPTPAGGAPQ